MKRHNLFCILFLLPSVAFAVLPPKSTEVTRNFLAAETEAAARAAIGVLSTNGDIQAPFDDVTVTTNAGGELQVKGTLLSLSTNNASALTNLAAQKVFNVIHYGATPWDTTNNGDHLAIQTAIWAAGDNGGGIVYLPFLGTGKYYLSDTSYLAEATSEGHPSLIVFRSTDNNITLLGDSGVEILPEAIEASPALTANMFGSGDDGAAPGLTNWPGCTNLTFDGFTINGGTNENDYVWDITQFYNCGPLTFRNMTFRNTQRGDGIDCTSTLLTVANCQFYDIYGSAVHSQLESYISYINDIYIENCGGATVDDSAIEQIAGEHWFKGVTVTNTGAILKTLCNTHIDGLRIFMPPRGGMTNMMATTGLLDLSNTRVTGSPTNSVGLYATNIDLALNNVRFVNYPALSLDKLKSCYIGGGSRFLNATYTSNSVNVIPAIQLDGCDNADISGVFTGSGQKAIYATGTAGTDSVRIHDSTFTAMFVEFADGGTNNLVQNCLFTGLGGIRFGLANSVTNTYNRAQGNVLATTTWTGPSTKFNTFDGNYIATLAFNTGVASSNTLVNNTIGLLTNYAGATYGTTTNQFWLGWNSTNGVGFMSGDGSTLTVDASAFSGNLTTDDNTLQELADVVDALVASGGWDGTTYLDGEDTGGLTNLVEVEAQTGTFGTLTVDTNNVENLYATNVITAWQSATMDGTNLVIDCNLGSFWRVYVGSTNVYCILSNGVAGQSGKIKIIGDGSTSKTYDVPAAYRDGSGSVTWTNALSIGWDFDTGTNDTNKWTTALQFN